MTAIEEPPARFPQAVSKYLIFLVAGAMFMENLDGTIITTALPAMARSFGRSAVDLNIGISAYLIALGIFIPASGWIADRFGSRSTFAAAITLFTASSALCGLSASLHGFVFVRVIQGLAGAMMVPVGRLVILRHTPKERMMDAMATLVWPSLIGPVLGPPLGGFITTNLGWSWIFYLNVPLGFIALLMSLWLVPDIRADEQAPFDWLGFALCGAGIFAVLSSLELLGQHIAPLSVAMFVAGLSLLAATLRHFRQARWPMVDLSAYRIPSFRMSMRGGSFSRMAIGSAPFLLALMFQVGFGFSPEKSGLLMLAVFGANLGMKAVTSQILRRFGFRPVIVWNGVLSAATLAACALLRSDTALILIATVLVVGGAARSMQFSALAMITYADVPKEATSAANGLSSTIFQLSMGAGVALGALSIRVGNEIARAIQWQTPSAPFSIAFLLVACVSLLGVLDAALLPHGVANQFAGRSSRPASVKGN